MAYCPNCATIVEAAATTCPACNADFTAIDGWRPVETKPLSDQPAKVHWVLTFLGWVFAMGLGAAYGTAAYPIFSKFYTVPASGQSGVMMLSFLVGVPLCIGAIVASVIRRNNKAGLGTAVSISPLAVLLFMFIAGALMREGFICILMALPFILSFAAIGAIISWILSAFAPDKSDKTLSAIIFMPFVFGAMEQNVVPPNAYQTIVKSVHIRAVPETIWRHINFPIGIRPDELAGGFAYRIGVPYPIEARTLDPRVGGRRHLVWQRGVSFEEEITRWDENRHIAWKYIFGPNSFPEGSLDDHIVIGGRYFNLEDTSYTLTPEAGGTRLDISVKVRVTTNFNWYAGAWAKFLISDTAETILNFYKNRAEAS